VGAEEVEEVVGPEVVVTVVVLEPPHAPSASVAATASASRAACLGADGVRDRSID